MFDLINHPKEQDFEYYNINNNIPLSKEEKHNLKVAQYSISFLAVMMNELGDN